MLTLEHKFTVEVEPEAISLFRASEYCVLLEIHVEVEYDGDELLEDARSIRVYMDEQDITGDLTRNDFGYISSLVSQEVTSSAYDIISKIDNECEMHYAKCGDY